MWALALGCAGVAAGAPAAPVAMPADYFEIVESVPEDTIYGQPGVPRTQAVWLDMIRHARQSVDIAAFYISVKPHSAMSPVLRALIERAEAGVHVRVLLDESFLKESAAALSELDGVRNVTVRILPVSKLTGGVLHAKYMVVDGDEVFVGSQNFDWRALTQIHEVGARITSRRFAQTFQTVFDFDWKLAADPSLPTAARNAVIAPGFPPVTELDPVVLDAHSAHPLVAFPAFSPPSMVPAWVTPEQPALVQFIDSAQHTLDIQVMLLSAINQYGAKGWWPAVDAAIRDAAARGVQVHIIVANWAMREPMQAYLQSLAALPNILVKFSTLPEAPQGFIPFARVEHAKYAIADRRNIYIGTGNWQSSYFTTTVDASVFVAGRGPAKTLTAIFDRDWNGPYVTSMQAGKHYVPPRIH